MANKEKPLHEQSKRKNISLYDNEIKDIIKFSGIKGNSLTEAIRGLLQIAKNKTEPTLRPKQRT